MIKTKELIILAASSALFLGSASGIIFYFNPYNSSSIIFILLYLSLFLFFTTFFTLLKLLFRKIKEFRQPVYINNGFNISFRHGILFSILLTVSLMMKGFKVWTWPGAISLFLLTIFLEIYFWKKTQIHT